MFLVRIVLLVVECVVCLVVGSHIGYGAELPCCHNGYTIENTFVLGGF